MTNQLERRRQLSLAATLCLFVIVALPQVMGFHLSFGQRFFKSATNPQLNPASTLIRPIECRNTNNRSEVGICMFSIDCMQNKGVPLSVCKHNYFVGTCCRLPDYNNFVGIVYDLRDTELGLDGRKVPSTQTTANQAAATVVAERPPQQQQTAPSSLAPQLPLRGELAAVITTLTSPTAQPTLLSSSNTQVRSSENQQEVAATANVLAAALPVVAISPLATLVAKPVEVEKLEDKYIISATSLFQASTAPTTQAPSSNNQQQQQSQESHQGTTKQAPTAPATSSFSESARNADGIVAPPMLPLSSALVSNRQPQQQQLTILSDSETFQVQATPPNQASSTSVPTDAGKQTTGASTSSIQQQQSAYEIVKDENSLEVLSTINSAHSPTTQQQFSIVEHMLAEAELRRGSLGINLSTEKLTADAQQQQSNQICLNDNQRQQTQHNIVFADNHKQSSTAMSSPLRSDQPATTISTSSQPATAATTAAPLRSSYNSQQQASDQEFTLASVTAAAVSTVTLAAEPSSSNTAAQSASTSTAATAGLSTTNKSEVLSQVIPSSLQLAANGNSTVSALVDLVSASNSTTQTTTPFTTSLSTALLPNISSHSYTAPTTLAPAAASSSSTATSNSSSQAAQLPLLVSSTHSFTVHQSLSPALGSKPVSAAVAAASNISQRISSTTSEPTLVSFSQLYSNQHSSSQQQLLHDSSSDERSSSSSGSSSPRPSLMSGSQSSSTSSVLQAAATKIVTGVSATNNLIPSLSGLQSAILSHIPFKIASGLSSGLSSYLQAAMKPNGNRPLLSSNTAPSLQYQQQMMHANSTTKLPPQNAFSSPALSSGNIRFPGSSSPSSSSMAPSSSAATSSSSSSLPSSLVTFVGDSASTALPLPASSSSWQMNPTGSGSSSTSSAPLAVGRDVVKEALQICGKPQVSASGQQTEAAAKKRVARIVGGNQSLFGQWPWMVSLRQWRKGAFLHKCGAALLNENWAITAAHCVENVKAADLLLRLGEFDVSNQEEPYPYLERRVKTVVAHPSFDPKTFEYDLALLRFAEPIKYERNIVPVCVPNGNDTYVDRMATVIGWGRLYEDGPLPDVIQHVDVPIITNNECEKMYKNAGYIEEIPDMFICAGISKGGRDSCEGDSGGPLTMVDHDSRSYLVGIISWGIGCALPSQPGVYTRITAFSGWINQITAF